MWRELAERIKNYRKFFAQIGPSTFSFYPRSGIITFLLSQITDTTENQKNDKL